MSLNLTHSEILCAPWHTGQVGALLFCLRDVVAVATKALLVLVLLVVLVCRYLWSNGLSLLQATTVSSTSARLRKNFMNSDNKVSKMKSLPLICLLVSCCLAAPSDPTAGSTTEAPTTIVIDDIVKDSTVIYTAKHDIVRIFAPINQFIFKHNPWADDWTIDSSSSEEEQGPRTVFFVEADINNGEKTEQGLYVYNNGKVTKLLDHGRDAVANNENVVYFGASDGIYKYNEAANTAEKYGSVTDNIVQFAFYNVTDTIYYVTANHEVFKLNTEATASEKVSQIKDVQALVFGYDRKIYYQDSQKNLYVYDDVNNVAPKKIEGLPAKIDRLALISPLLGMEEGSLLLVNKDVYFIKPDATASKSKARVEGTPTAYEPKPTYFQFYAENKKLHEIDISTILAKLSGLAS